MTSTDNHRKTSKLGKMAFFRVDAEMRRRIRSASKAKELTTAQLVRRAVREYLDRLEGSEPALAAEPSDAA